MSRKWFNLFHVCASWYVHLPPQEEECTSSSIGDSKMHTSGSIANSQRMLTEINESGSIAKLRIWVKSDTVKHLKAFKITLSKMQISLLILSWKYFSCLHIQRIFLTYFHMSLKCFFQSLGPRYTCQFFWKKKKKIAYEQYTYFNYQTSNFLEYIF